MNMGKEVGLSDANHARITSKLDTGMSMLEISKNRNRDFRTIKNFVHCGKTGMSERVIILAIYLQDILANGKFRRKMTPWEE